MDRVFLGSIWLVNIIVNLKQEALQLARVACEGFTLPKLQSIYTMRLDQDFFSKQKVHSYRQVLSMRPVMKDGGTCSPDIRFSESFQR